MTGNTEVVRTLKIFVAKAWSYCLVTTFALSRMWKCQLYLWLRMFVQRYLVWDIKHLIEEAACEINVDMGMDGPVECPLPTPCWMPLAPPWVAPPCLLLPKQLNFMQIQPPPLGINPLLWAQSANIYIFILNNTVSTSFGPKTKDL